LVHIKNPKHYHGDSNFQTFLTNFQKGGGDANYFDDPEDDEEKFEQSDMKDRQKRQKRQKSKPQYRDEKHGKDQSDKDSLNSD
jgi:hypothetical protein